MRRKFVEYLGTDCFHFCRIPVELSVADGLLEADCHVGLQEGPQHQFNKNNIYL
jgi:hypothetical protein